MRQDNKIYKFSITITLYMLGFRISNLTLKKTFAVPYFVFLRKCFSVTIVMRIKRHNRGDW